MTGVRVLEVSDVRSIVKTVGLKEFMTRLYKNMERDLPRWDEFDKTPRHASFYEQGVIELMPITDKDYYAFKLVNGHPNNPKKHKLTIVATGMLATPSDGFPILITEMTLLTALRTAVTSAIASTYLAKKREKTFGIIGNGAQSEFQVLAHHYFLGMKEIYYFDIDPKAMKKFGANLQEMGLNLHPCRSAKEVVERSSLVTTATAEKGHHKVVHNEWVEPGMHINGIGGDCPGKTEIDVRLVERAKIVVENFEQTRVEGEIQQLKDQKVHAELWELVSGEKKGRESDKEITLFDSVGFAIEDYSIIRLVYDYAQEHGLGRLMEMVPTTKDPKNLFHLIV